MTNYTNVNKPSSTAYTNLAKPTISNGTTTTTLRQGRGMGLMIPLTMSLPGMTTTTAATYTKVSKPSTTSYTNVSKPT